MTVPTVPAEMPAAAPAVYNPARIQDYYDQVHRASWARRGAGIFAGATAGIIFGSAIGLIAAFLPAILAAMGIAGAVAGLPSLGLIAATVATYAGFGAFGGIAATTAVGASAGAVAGGLALQEHREIQHPDKPAETQMGQTPDPGPSGAKLFSWRPSAFFATISSAFGAMIAASGNPIVTSAAGILFGAVSGPAAIVASAVMFGLFGSLFGFKAARITNYFSNFYMDILTDEAFKKKQPMTAAVVSNIVAPLKDPIAPAQKQPEPQPEPLPHKSFTAQHTTTTPRDIMAQRMEPPPQESLPRSL